MTDLVSYHKDEGFMAIGFATVAFVPSGSSPFGSRRFAHQSTIAGEM